MKERSTDSSSLYYATCANVAALALGAMFAGQAAAGENPCVENTSVSNWLTVPICEAGNGIAHGASSVITSTEIAVFGNAVGIPGEAVDDPSQGTMFGSETPSS